MTQLPRKKRHGQVAIFMVMIIFILFFVVLFNYDLHRIIHVKNKTQNAGDAAALAAARWQVITLNTIGDLNLLNALAIANADTNASIAINDVQARLLFTGPITGLMAAQQAAKNNGIYENEAFSDELRSHAQRVREDYGVEVGGNGEQLFPEPYTNAWREYAAMLDVVAINGVAAGPDNISYFGDYAGGHYLLDVGFYDAVAGRIWCWFYHHAPTLLVDYEPFSPCWWDALPPIPRRDYINSEIYGLGLLKVTTALTNFAGVEAETIETLAEERGVSDGTDMTDEAMATNATWYVYGATWGPWELMPKDEDSGHDFPVAGYVKPQYDYAGADACIRVETETGRLTPGKGGVSVTNSISWVSAAKGFGALETDKPTIYGIVLPAFTDVRLIPVSASSRQGAGSYNLGWRRHIEEHLPGFEDENGRWLAGYMSSGPGAPACSFGCHFCRQLRVWEHDSFREAGFEWLKDNSHECTATDGGTKPGGGTQIAH